MVKYFSVEFETSSNRWVESQGPAALTNKNQYSFDKLNSDSIVKRSGVSIYHKKYNKKNCGGGASENLKTCRDSSGLDLPKHVN
jgi:hypothetical protein